MWSSFLYLEKPLLIGHPFSCALSSLFLSISSKKCICYTFEKVFSLYLELVFIREVFFPAKPGKSKKFGSTSDLSINIVDRAARCDSEQQWWFLHLLLSDCWHGFLYSVFGGNLYLSVAKLGIQVREDGKRGKQTAGFRGQRGEPRHVVDLSIPVAHMWPRPSVMRRPSSKRVFPSWRHLAPFLVQTGHCGTFQFVVLALLPAYHRRYFWKLFQKT